MLVTPGARWWRLKFRVADKEKLLSLGVYPDVSLKDARQRRGDVTLSSLQRAAALFGRQLRLELV